VTESDLERERAAVDLLRRRIVNVVGHELKVPVSTIRGLAEALGRATPEEVRDELGPALVRYTARLERLVDDLLLASGVFTVRPVEAPASRALAPVVQEAWTEVGGTGSLAIDGAADTRALVRADALERILHEVLDNAVKYGRAPVAVRVDGSDGVARVEVSTAGAPGPDDVALATEPFFRGEGAVTAAPGLGIGLAVAAALASQDGGRVVVHAEGDRLVTVVELPAG
jgi:signal transduction histidine kinase